MILQFWCIFTNQSQYSLTVKRKCIKNLVIIGTIFNNIKKTLVGRRQKIIFPNFLEMPTTTSMPHLNTSKGLLHISCRHLNGMSTNFFCPQSDFCLNLILMIFYSEENLFWQWKWQCRKYTFCFSQINSFLNVIKSYIVNTYFK